MASLNKRLYTILLTATALLLIPLIAMQFSTEVNWELADFLVMGALLLGTGVAIELVLRKIKSKKSRIILVAIVIVLLLLVWAELAVGIFGTPFAGS